MRTYIMSEFADIMANAVEIWFTRYESSKTRLGSYFTVDTGSGCDRCTKIYFVGIDLGQEGGEDGIVECVG